MAHVFISYSRSDRSFVDRLRHSLEGIGKETWIDWEDIPPSAQWIQEIFVAIAGADAFVFVISPESVASSMCRRELAHAVGLNKRILPVVCKPTNPDILPESIRGLQWISFLDEAEHPQRIDELAKAVDADLEWVRMHTRLLERATEWANSGHNKGLLLRGISLREAETWLAAAALKEPKPIASQIDLILQSRRHSRRLQQIAFGAVTVALLVTLLLATIAFLERNAAERQRIIAESRELNARAINALGTDPLRAMLLAIEAGRRHPTDEVGDVLMRALELPSVVAVLQHGSPVQRASFNPKGDLILTSTADGKGRLWSVSAGRQERLLAHQERAVTHVMFSPSGEIAVTIDGKAHVWRVVDGVELSTLSVENEEIQNAVFGVDDRIITTVATSGTVRVWNVLERRVLRAIPHPAGVMLHAEAALSRTARFLATTEFLNGKVRLHDLLQGRQLYELTGSSPERLMGESLTLIEPTFSQDERMVATGGDSLGARLTALSDGRQLATVTHEAGTVTSVSFRNDGQVLVTSGDDGTARFWTVTGQPVGVLAGHDGPINYAAFSSDGRLVVTAGADGAARIWNLAGGAASHVLSGHQAIINRARFSPNGRHVLTAGSDKTARLWDSASGRQTHALSPACEVFDASFSRDGEMAVTGCREGTGAVWRVADGRRLAVLSGHKDAIYRATFSPDGKTIVTASADDTARLWNVADGRTLRTLSGHDDSVLVAVYSSDGRWLLTAGGETARLWSGTGELVHTLKGHTAALDDAAFSPTGEFVVTASTDKTAKIWSVQNGRLLHTLSGHGDSVFRVAFDRAGEQIATFSYDSSVKLWSARDGRAIRTLAGHRGWVLGGTFSPDGRYLLSHGRDGTARLWSLSDGRHQRTFTHRSAVIDATFSEDGTMIVTAAADGTAYIYPTHVDQLLKLAESRLPGNLRTADRERLLQR